ncbi:MAG: sulfatase, partial [Fuerstiella sp.]|nr:sulfatase [Fuerstiella sp.]
MKNCSAHSRNHSPIAVGRRGMLARCGMGFGGLALGAMLKSDTAQAAAARSTNPLLPKAAH